MNFKLRLSTNRSKRVISVLTRVAFGFSIFLVGLYLVRISIPSQIHNDRLHALFGVGTSCFPCYMNLVPSVTTRAQFFEEIESTSDIRIGASIKKKLSSSDTLTNKLFSWN